jgi:uncharacterized protein (TIGR00299 family) protein
LGFLFWTSLGSKVNELTNLARNDHMIMTQQALFSSFQGNASAARPVMTASSEEFCMRTLHFDPFSGISGDMTVAALRDLGVPEDIFQKALSSLPLTLPPCRFEKAERGGIAGWRFLVEGHDGQEGTDAAHHHHHAPHHGHSHDHAHNADHDHVHGRNHAEIAALLRDSSLEEPVKKRCLSVFSRIAEAEGGIHGVPPETVGFHEVGAEDSIADIVAACAGFEYLRIEHFTCGPLIEGSGHIHCAHGTFPLPAPATLALLKGIPFRQVEEPWEHITPTGAAILAEYAGAFAVMPEMSVSNIGYGLGSRNTPNRPNVLRMILGETGECGKTSAEHVVEIRCNLDDLTPEHAAHALDRILSKGALDATLTPTLMKKGRSGWILEVLCHPGEETKFSSLVLSETTAFGVRHRTMERHVLKRCHETVRTAYGDISVKIGTLGGKTLQQSPEFSSCAEAAELHGVPVRLVHQAALAALVRPDQP